MSKTPNNHPEQETHTQEPQGQATTEQEATPPWERDGEEFNPERAWTLIQALRAEKEQLKTKAEQAAAQSPPGDETACGLRKSPYSGNYRRYRIPPAPIMSALSGVARSAGVGTYFCILLGGSP